MEDHTGRTRFAFGVDMDWLRIERSFIALATLAVGAFTLWILIDETRQSWDRQGWVQPQGWVYKMLFSYWVAWCLFPGINALIGCLTKRPRLVHTCTVLTLLYVYFYCFVALDIATQNLQFDHDQHLILFPILSVFFFSIVHLVGLKMPPLRRK